MTSKPSRATHLAILQTDGAADHLAARRVQRADLPAGGGDDPLAHGGCGSPDRDATPERVRAAVIALGDPPPQEVVGDVAGGEARSGRCAGDQPVQPERAPVLPGEIPGDEEPAVTDVHHPVRLDLTSTPCSVVPDVVDSEPLVVSGCRGHSEQDLDRDDRAGGPDNGRTAP